MLKLTERGKKRASAYISELEAKRKEILDAGKDTAIETNLPTVEDIEQDLRWFAELDEDGEYWNCWGVTDNYSADTPLTLAYGQDFVNM